eukprot:753611-Amphidinium_carterae.1
MKGCQSSNRVTVNIQYRRLWTVYAERIRRATPTEADCLTTEWWAKPIREALGVDLSSVKTLKYGSLCSGLETPLIAAKV